MTRKKAYLIAQAALCALLCALLAAGTIRIYVQGSRAVAAGEPGPIFTRERIAAVLAAALPVFAALIVLNVGALIARLSSRSGGAPSRVSSSVPVDMPGKEADKTRIAVVRVVLLAVAIAMIAAGIANGGMRDALTKAVYICMECVGLG